MGSKLTGTRVGACVRRIGGLPTGLLGPLAFLGFLSYPPVAPLWPVEGAVVIGVGTDDELELAGDAVDILLGGGVDVSIRPSKSIMECL